MKRYLSWMTAVLVLAALSACASDRDLKEKAQGHIRVGTAHMQAGQDTAALKELLEAEKLTPRDPVIHYYLGIAYDRKGFPEDAVREFRRALELKPDYSEVQNYLGTIYLNQQQYDAAIASFNKAIANPLYETPSVALYNMGRAYVAKGDLRAAQASFNEAIRREPNTYLMPVLELNLGVISYRENAFSDAERHLTRAVDLTPNLAEGWYWLGMTQMQLRKRKDSEESFKKVISLAPNSEWAKKSAEALNRP